MILFRIFILILLPLICLSQNTYSVATLKYNGGGDWYANPTALPNLIEFSNNNKDFHSYTFELEQYRNSWGA